MAVDVTTEIIIGRPVNVVASFAGDPSNAPAWYENIKSVEWKSDPPITIGSQVAFTAHFLGRELAYTYEIVDLIPGRQLVMRTAQGPFPMETTYTWRSVNGSTRMTVRNRGKPSGFSKFAAPVMAVLMKRVNRKDLERLRVLLEEE